MRAWMIRPPHRVVTRIIGYSRSPRRSAWESQGARCIGEHQVCTVEPNEFSQLLDERILRGLKNSDEILNVPPPLPRSPEECRWLQGALKLIEWFEVASPGLLVELERKQVITSVLSMDASRFARSRNSRRKIVREDADRRRLIGGLERTILHSCQELLSYVASWPSGRAFREPTADATCRVGSKRNGRRRQSCPRICRQSSDRRATAVDVRSAWLRSIRVPRRAGGSKTGNNARPGEAADPAKPPGGHGVQSDLS
jgi:hypothetical protein